MPTCAWTAEVKVVPRWTGKLRYNMYPAQTQSHVAGLERRTELLHIGPDYNDPLTSTRCADRIHAGIIVPRLA